MGGEERLGKDACGDLGGGRDGDPARLRRLYYYFVLCAFKNEEIMFGFDLNQKMKGNNPQRNNPGTRTPLSGTAAIFTSRRLRSI